jgi:hypothetical protein
MIYQVEQIGTLLTEWLTGLMLPAATLFVFRPSVGDETRAELWDCKSVGTQQHQQQSTGR